MTSKAEAQALISGKCGPLNCGHPRCCRDLTDPKESCLWCGQLNALVYVLARKTCDACEHQTCREARAAITALNEPR